MLLKSVNRLQYFVSVILEAHIIRTTFVREKNQIRYKSNEAYSFYWKKSHDDDDVPFS